MTSVALKPRQTGVGVGVGAAPGRAGRQAVSGPTALVARTAHLRKVSRIGDDSTVTTELWLKLDRIETGAWPV